MQVPGWFRQGSGRFRARAAEVPEGSGQGRRRFRQGSGQVPGRFRKVPGKGGGGVGAGSGLVPEGSGH